MGRRVRSVAWGVLGLLVAGFVAGCDREASKAGGADSSGTVAAPSASVAAAPAKPPEPVLVPLTNMVPIKAGSFVRMKRQVTLTRDFWIGKFEVTQGEYSSLMSTNPSYFAGDLNCPVEKVRHGDAAAYCTSLTRREREAGRLPAGYEYRLPTEAEWEYACRAGSTNHFSFGDATSEAGKHAWTEENSEGRTHPVGQKEPNAWGLHDMHGNVWEWCADWFADYPAADVTDPVGPAQGKFKVYHGGSWNNEVKFARASNRFMMAPTSGIHFVGFRIALAPVVATQAPAPGAAPK